MKILQIIVILIIASYFIYQALEGKGHKYYTHMYNKAQKEVNARNQAIGENDHYVYCTSIPDWTASWWDGTCRLD